MEAHNETILTELNQAFDSYVEEQNNFWNTWQASMDSIQEGTAGYDRPWTWELTKKRRWSTIEERDLQKIKKDEVIVRAPWWTNKTLRKKYQLRRAKCIMYTLKTKHRIEKYGLQIQEKKKMLLIKNTEIS